LSNIPRLVGISIAFSGAILIGVGICFLRMAHKKRRRKQRQNHLHPHPPHPQTATHTRSTYPHHNRAHPPFEPDYPDDHPDHSDSYSDSEATVDDDREYALLFRRWNWHTRIPYIRRLWEWKLYTVRRQRHRMRRSQEGVEWDYPLSRWRYGVIWRLHRAWRHQRKVKGGRKKNGIGENARAREEDECVSDDEKARNYELGLEHRGRMNLRREMVADAARAVGAWFGYMGGDRRRKGEDGEEEGGEEVEQLGVDTQQGVLPSLRSVFRRRQRVVDEEMGIGRAAESSG